ncbi:hypothetical protein [Frankia sp. CiP1_Cm_nod2]|uniref:hypothetical protein n=1 Tax=Frankia sp. CiP1_Cm_nod2 TaxID=2897161 RepID=UPI00202455B0
MVWPVGLFEPGIAFVTNRLGDVLAYPDGFGLLARPSGLLDSDSPSLTRNVLTLLFRDRLVRDHGAKAAFPPPSISTWTPRRSRAGSPGTPVRYWHRLSTGPEAGGSPPLRRSGH